MIAYQQGKWILHHVYSIKQIYKLLYVKDFGEMKPVAFSKNDF